MLYGNLKELFDISINAEKEAKKLYEALTLKFSEHAQASKFFTEMAEDEDLHIAAIEGMRQGLSADKLDMPVAKSTMVIVRKFLNFAASHSSENIQTLGDALKAVVNYEFSEANKLYELLMEMHEADEDKLDAFKRALKSHQDKATGFKNSGLDMSYRP